MARTQNSDTIRRLLDRLVGEWTTVATHPAMPGVIVHGTAVVEWLEGQRFQIHRARTDHPDFPDSLSVIGDLGHDRAEGIDSGPPRLRMHYYDSRGVYRDNETSISETAWEWHRMAPGFSQRFTGTFADGGNTIVGLSQLNRDDAHWADDLQITFRRKR